MSKIVIVSVEISQPSQTVINTNTLVKGEWISVEGDAPAVGEIYNGVGAGDLGDVLSEVYSHGYQEGMAAMKKLLEGEQDER